MGKFLILIGLLLVISGVIVEFSRKIPFLGNLPGDIKFQRGNFSFYLPLASSIVLSILLSLVIYFLNRGRS